MVPNSGAGRTSSLLGVAALSADDVWAVGHYTDDNGYSSSHAQPLVMHWNGNQWRTMYAPAPSDSPPDRLGSSLTGVAPVSHDEVWAVGWRASGAGPFSSSEYPIVGRYHDINVSARNAQIFSDVPPSSPFYPYVQCLACRSIVTGYSDGTFRPEQPVTRGQLSKMLAKASGLSVYTAGTFRYFQDVQRNSPFYDPIMALSNHGYITGYPCGGDDEPCVEPGNLPYFRPGAGATRGQLAKVVANVESFTDAVSGQTFSDVLPDSPFYMYIERLVKRGIISGYADGTFQPGNLASRGQMAKIVSNTFFAPANNLGQTHLNWNQPKMDQQSHYAP